MRVSVSGPKLNQAALSWAASTIKIVSSLPSRCTRALRMVLIEPSLTRTQAWVQKRWAWPSWKISSSSPAMEPDFMSATITKWAGPWLFSGSARAPKRCGWAGPLLVSGIVSAARSLVAALGLCGRRGLEKRRQRGVFSGRMEMLLAGARNEGMVRQPVLGMEALHLLKTIGAIDAATDADCPGFGHGGSAR